MLQFHKYEDLTESKIREVVGDSRVMLIYDTKPRFSIPSVSAIDVGTFMISCWRGTLEISAEIVVFHLRKLTDDFLYTYFRNQYENVHIFSSDSCIEAVFAKPEKTHEIVLVPRQQVVVPDLLSRSEVQAYLGSSCSSEDCSKLHDLYAGFVGMAHLYAYKVNMAASLVCDAANSGCAVAALTRSKKLLSNSTMLDAHAELDRSQTICIVFEVENDFDYSSFRRCIFVVEDRKNAEDIPITSREFELVRALCPKQSILGDMLDIGLGEFRDYMMADSASTLALIAEKTLVSYRALPFHRVDELSVGKVFIPVTYARQLLDAVLLEVKQSLESIYLFVRSAAPRIMSEHGGLLDREFQSTVSVPGLFDFESKSMLFLTKRESVADCCCKFIMRLHEEKLVDDHLRVVLEELLALDTVKSLLVKAYGTPDLSAVARIRAAYLDSHDLSAVGSIVERNDTVELDYRNGTSTPSDIFKKRHIVNATDNLQSTEPPIESCPSGTRQYFHAECPSARLERCYRKIPTCLCASDSTMAFYIFSNSETGMLCLESTRESCAMVNETNEAVCISYAGSRKYSDRELELLRLYQVLFFRHHGEAVPSHSQALRLHYYVAPLDTHHCIDWTYLKKLSDAFLSSPVIQSISSENLVWNPFSREFLVYIGRFEKGIEDKIEGQSYLEYFERKYRVALKVRTGQVMFRAFLSDHVSSSIRKHLNARLNGSLDDIVSGCISSPKPKTAIISSSEICFATPVRVSILKEVEVFKRNYRLAETVFIAHELIGAFGIKATLQTVVRCLTQACESPLQNYERLEFLGDCVMKFSATSHFYHLMLPIDQIVLAKNSIVCNDNLFRVCIESGLFRYVHAMSLSPKMVQAPSLSGAEDTIEYFNASGIFRSDNLSHHIAKAFDPSMDVRKLYADAVEALVGGIFLESGISSAVEFMCRLKVLRTVSHSSHPAEAQTLSRTYDYLGLMGHEDILAVQKIIGYRFKNPGCLERAFVHPSFARTLGSTDFQYLELIGDCSLDLFVSLHVFNNASLDSPMLLHSARASYVNNTALHRILHRTGLAAHTKHCLDESTASKAYSDMVEALIGAVLVDLGWDVRRFMDVMDRQFRKYLEDYRCM